MNDKIWFAKIFTDSRGDVMLTCRPLKIAKETPRRWYLDTPEVQDRGLAHYHVYVPKENDFVGNLDKPTFYATTESEVLELLLGHTKTRHIRLRTESEIASIEFTRLNKKLNDY